jgi:hypothetical protein
MKLKSLLAGAAMAAASLFSTSALADTNTGTISQVTTDANGTIAVFTGQPVQCAGNGWNISVIWTTDSNYKTLVSMLLAARSTGATTVVVTTVNGSNHCQISSVTVQN